MYTSKKTDRKEKSGDILRKWEGAEYSEHAEWPGNK